MSSSDTGSGPSGASRGIAGPSSEGALRGRRVLLVEDVRVIADYLADLLTDLGCTVVGPFGDELRAAKAVAEGAIDAAVLDQQLALETTSALAIMLVERRIPFLYVTGYSPEFADPGFPAAPMLEKPFSPREFEQALLRLLENPPRN